MTLKDFAEKNAPKKNGSVCWTCSIPEAAELAEAYAAGVSPSVMARWLIQERGYDEAFGPLRQRLYHHFQGGHVAQAAR